MSYELKQIQTRLNKIFDRVTKQDEEIRNLKDQNKYLQGRLSFLANSCVCHQTCQGECGDW